MHCLHRTFAVVSLRHLCVLVLSQDRGNLLDVPLGYMQSQQGTLLPCYHLFGLQPEQNRQAAMVQYATPRHQATCMYSTWSAK